MIPRKDLQRPTKASHDKNIISNQGSIQYKENDLQE